MSMAASWVQYQVGLKIRYFLLHMMTYCRKNFITKTLVSWMNKKETQKSTFLNMSFSITRESNMAKARLSFR